MLLSIQFPFADFRRFLHRSTGFIGQPGWPSPVFRIEHPENAPFVKGFGAVKRRNRGGLEFWGEDVICDDRHAIKWPSPSTYKTISGRTGISFEIAFRRWFSDGLTVGKYELGIATTERGSFCLAQDESGALMRWFVDHPVSAPPVVSQLPGPRQTCRLRDVPQHLQKRLFLATTRSAWLARNSFQQWWIESGSPLLFVQRRSDSEEIDLTPLVKRVRLDRFGIDITGYTLIIKAAPASTADNEPAIPLWVMATDRVFDRTVARQLRLCILRMHAEHECLRSCLDLINTGKIPIKRGSAATESLQLYLNEATKKLFRNQTILERLCGGRENGDPPDISLLAYSLFEKVWPGSVASLEMLLKTVDIRRNIGLNVGRYSLSISC